MKSLNDILMEDEWEYKIVKDFEKYNLIRNEEKEEEAKQYSANKKYNL